MIQELASDDLDYLQRTGFEPTRLAGVPPPAGVPDALRSLLRVDAVGVFSKARFHLRQEPV